jgi:hypothetical protein
MKANPVMSGASTVAIGERAPVSGMIVTSPKVVPRKWV